MKQKLEKILMALCVAGLLITHLPPIQVQGAAAALPIASEGVNAIIDVINVVSGVQIGLGSNPCICDHSIPGQGGLFPWENCLQSTQGGICVAQQAQDQEYYWHNLRHAELIRGWNRTAPDTELAPGATKGRIRTSGAEMDYYIEKFRRNANRPGYEPPEQKPPHWVYRVIAGSLVPVALFSSNAEWLEAVLTNHGDLATEIMREARGYYWCVEHEDFFHRDYWHLRPERPEPPPGPHSLLIGYCSSSGLPIFGNQHSRHINAWDRITTPFFTAIRRHTESQVVSGKHQFIYNGNTYQVYKPTPNQIVLRRNGETVTQMAIGNMTEVVGIIKIEGDNQQPRVVVKQPAPHDNFIVMHGIFNANFFREITTPVPPTTQPSPSPDIALAPKNVLNDRDSLVDHILAIANDPETDESNDPLIAIPILIPELFPEIPPEEFPEFARRFLERLTPEEIIIPGREATEIRRQIPTMPWLFPPELPGIGTAPQPNPQPNPQPQPGLRPQDLREIERQLQEQTRIQENMARDIGDMSRVIRDVSTPGEIDFSPLRRLPAALTTLFPFSIPWDLSHAFVAVFAPGYVARAPVFVIDLSETILMYRIELDLAEFESMVVPIRWGLMVTFLVGLIIATGKLIKW